jgi:hypothetical protein
MSQTYLTEHKRDRRGRESNDFDMADLLDVVDRYESAFPTSDARVQDSFVLNALEVLTYEPLAQEPLHPLNWKTGKPGLELEIRLTSKGTVALDALTPEEKTQHTQSGWSFSDFERFPLPSRPGARPRFTCFELELEDLGIEMRDPAMRVDAELAVRRELIFSSYEYVVRRLSQHFNCSVKTGLVCVGPSRRLYIRNMTVTENPVEYANLLAASHGVRWHTRYLTLCKLEGVSPDELLAFFRSSIAHLKEEEQEGTLRQYLGKAEPDKRTRYSWQVPKDEPTELTPLLGALKVVAYSKAFPPLVDHPSPKVCDLLERVLHKHTPHGIAAFAQLYWMDEFDVRKMLREYYPQLLIGELAELKEYFQEIKTLLKDTECGVERAQPFLAALLPAIQKEWAALGDTEAFPARRGKLARRCGFRELHELHAWAKDNAPAVVEWLATGQQAHEQKKAEARRSRKNSVTPKQV